MEYSMMEATAEPDTTCLSPLELLPREALEMIAEYLVDPKDLFNLRLVSHQTKKHSSITFRNKLKLQLAYIDTALTRSALETLLALVSGDISFHIQIIKIHSATMSDTALGWSETPDLFKSRLKSLLLREHIDFNEGVDILRRVFSHASKLPNLRRICVGDLSLERNDIGINYIGLPILPQYLRKFIRELELDQVSADDWQEDTEYIVYNHCVDAFRRSDLTIATTLAALSGSRDWVLGQNVQISVSLSDCSYKKYWERRTAPREVIAWRRAQDVGWPPALYSTILGPMYQESKSLLERKSLLCRVSIAFERSEAQCGHGSSPRLDFRKCLMRSAEISSARRQSFRVS